MLLFISFTRAVISYFSYRGIKIKDGRYAAYYVLQYFIQFYTKIFEYYKIRKRINIVFIFESVIIFRDQETI